MRVERERHLRVGALYTEAKDIIATRKLQSRAKGSSSLPGATTKVYDSMHNVILAAEVTHSLVLEPPTATAPGGDKPTTPHRGEASGKTCVTLLGLKKEEIELAIASKAPSKFAEVAMPFPLTRGNNCADLPLSSHVADTRLRRRCFAAGASRAVPIHHRRTGRAATTKGAGDRRVQRSPWLAPDSYLHPPHHRVV